MTSYKRLIKYLSGRKTPASVTEIQVRTGINTNTLRKLLGYKTHQGEIIKVKYGKCFKYRLARFTQIDAIRLLTSNRT
jgi:hypothetical protein